MNYKFYPESSRIAEFVYFPTLAFYEKSEKAFGALFPEILNPASMDRWDRIAEDLSGVKDQYDQFQISGFSFFFGLMFHMDLRQFRTEEDYLRQVRSLGRDDLTAYLTEFLDNNLDISLPAFERSERYISEAFRVLSTSSLDNSDKWKLLAILEDIEGMRDRYADFMESIIDRFARYYGEVEYAVAAYARQLEKQLTEQDIAPLEAMLSQYLVTESFNALRNSNTIHFWFLGIQDYSFTIRPKDNETHLILGINVLDYYFKLSQFELKSKEERITVFKNLSDKTRYEVLKLIAHGDSSTKVLAEKLGVTSAAISYHLKQLGNDRLIQFDANRRKNGYRISETRMKEAIAGLLEDLNIK